MCVHSHAQVKKKEKAAAGTSRAVAAAFAAGRPTSRSDQAFGPFDYCYSLAASVQRTSEQCCSLVLLLLLPSIQSVS